MISLSNFVYNPSNVLGSGAFGWVYKGHYKERPSEEVAIKIIRKKPHIQKAMDRELKILKALSELKHEHILLLLEFQDKVNEMILVTEYCDGGDLHNYLESTGGKLDEFVTSVFLYQIAQGLAALHEHNCVHRDLKPQNILISFASGADRASPFNVILKIADLGLARLLPDGDLASTVCGTPLYMAPEIREEKRYDCKADLWSVAVIILQCFIGFGLLLQYCRKNIPLLTKIPDSISLDAQNLLQNLLQIRPEDRLSFDVFIKHPMITKVQPFYDTKRELKARELELKAKEIELASSIAKFEKSIAEKDLKLHDYDLRMKFAEQRAIDDSKRHLEEVQRIKQEKDLEVKQWRDTVKQCEEKLKRKCAEESQMQLQAINDVQRLKTDLAARNAQIHMLMNRLSARDCQLVVAVELGCASTSYAFSFKKEFRSDPFNITVNSTWESSIFNGSTLIAYKAPSTIVVDANFRYVAFGYAAEETAAVTSSQNGNHILHFFPKHLNSIKNDNVALMSDDGVEVPAVSIISETLRYIKGHLMGSYLVEKLLEFSQSEIHWVVTVPFKPDETIQHLFYQAASLAGISKNQLVLLSDIQALSVYCHYLPLDKMTRSDSQTFSSGLLTGSKFIILQLQEKSVFIGVFNTGCSSVNILNKSGNLSTAMEASWLQSGMEPLDNHILLEHGETLPLPDSLCIAHVFSSLLVKLVSNDIVETLQNHHSDDYEKFLKSIEKELHKVDICSNDMLHFPLPGSFRSLLSGILSNGHVKHSFGSRLQLNDSELCLHQSLLRELFEPGVIYLSKLISDCNGQKIEKHFSVSTVFLFGSFCEEKSFLVQFLETICTDVRFVCPNDGQKATVKGAVIFGHEPCV